MKTKNINSSILLLSILFVAVFLEGSSKGINFAHEAIWIQKENESIELSRAHSEIFNLGNQSYNKVLNSKQMIHPVNISACDNFAEFIMHSGTDNECCFYITIDCTIPIHSFYVDVVPSSIWTQVPTALNAADWTTTFIPGTTNRYLWTYNLGSMTGFAQLGTICFNFNSDQTVSYGFSSTSGAPWFCEATAPPLTPCNVACDKSALFRPWPSPNLNCCYDVVIDGLTSINTFAVFVPHLSTNGIAPSVPGWTTTFTPGSSLVPDRYYWLCNSGTVNGLVNLGTLCFNSAVLGNQQISYTFGTEGTWICENYDTIPPCVGPTQCNISIEATPSSICNNQGSTIISTGYTGNGTIEWYKATQDPGGAQAPAFPWTSIGTGSSMNTGNLLCNPLTEVTTYWYQAILTDPNCTNSPIVTNVVTVTVNPVFALTIIGPMILCNPGSTNLTLDGLGNNFSCTILWKDLQTNTPIIPPLSSQPNKISLQGLTSSFSDCPFKIYHYSVTVCDGLCNPTIPFDIKVFSNSKATKIKADKDHICWGEDTKLYIVDDDYCGDIQWQINSISGTGGLWVDIAGAINTLHWNTDRLIEDTKYRVKFTNGICPEVYSPEITVHVQKKVTALISYHPQSMGGICPGLLCPIVKFDLNINPTTSTWQWYHDGSPVGGTNQLLTFATDLPGNYTVVVTDPVCGNVTSNVLNVFPLTALLSGPSCVCFTPTSVVDLTITTNCATLAPFMVKLLKNGNSIYSGIQIPDIDGKIILTNISISQGDKFEVLIQGQSCSEVMTNLYKPEGCNCPH